MWERFDPVLAHFDLGELQKTMERIHCGRERELTQLLILPLQGQFRLCPTFGYDPFARVKARKDELDQAVVHLAEVNLNVKLPNEQIDVSRDIIALHASDAEAVHIDPESYLERICSTWND
jgi:hypothetical protein